MKKNGCFSFETDGRSDSIDAIQRRLDTEITMQGNILFVMDGHRVNCGNELNISAARLY